MFNHTNRSAENEAWVDVCVAREPVRTAGIVYIGKVIHQKRTISKLESTSRSDRVPDTERPRVCVLDLLSHLIAELDFFYLAFTETVNNYEIVSPVVRSRSGDFSGEVSHRLMCVCLGVNNHIWNNLTLLYIVDTPQRA